MLGPRSCSQLLSGAAWFEPLSGTELNTGISFDGHQRILYANMFLYVRAEGFLE
jgi:hypothetical protein